VRVPRRRRVPPVLDVSFDKLSRRGMQEMCATDLGPRNEQRQRVLNLVAKPNAPPAGTARCAPRPGSSVTDTAASD
jgi:hypothetical protein